MAMDNFVDHDEIIVSSAVFDLVTPLDPFVVWQAVTGGV